jgi:glycosyltransferase involved in cell wall biosynthesis
MASVLIVSFVEWAGAFQRPQHLALGLARRGWDVTYASPGYLHRRARRFDSGLELPPNLRVVEPPQLPGASRWRAAAAINLTLMQRNLARLRSSPWDAIVFNDPRWASVVRSLPARRRVFDCMDDLSGASPSAAWAARMEALALEVADRVWTGTASLADRLQGRHRDVRFHPGGVDSAHFGAPDPDEVGRALGDLPAGDGPLAGYFGVLNERLDLDRILALMKSGPWRVLLIGPSTSRAPRLPDDPRLRWIGPRPYARLPAYLAHFNLGLIPYRTDGPHRFLYPVKALEYLAGGKPVLATPLPDICRFLGDYVELADTPDEWTRAGERLLRPAAAALARVERGRLYARAHTWDAMVDGMQHSLTESLQNASSAGREDVPDA